MWLFDLFFLLLPEPNQKYPLMYTSGYARFWVRLRKRLLDWHVSLRDTCKSVRVADAHRARAKHLDPPSTFREDLKRFREARRLANDAGMSPDDPKYPVLASYMKILNR